MGGDGRWHAADAVRLAACRALLWLAWRIGPRGRPRLAVLRAREDIASWREGLAAMRRPAS